MTKQQKDAMLADRDRTRLRCSVLATGLGELLRDSDNHYRAEYVTEILDLIDSELRPALQEYADADAACERFRAKLRPRVYRRPTRNHRTPPIAVERTTADAKTD